MIVYYPFRRLTNTAHSTLEILYVLSIHKH